MKNTEAENLQMSHDYTVAQFTKQIEQLEYQQWQEEYRKLVFAKEIRVTDAKPTISRRAKRRQRNKGK